MTLSSRGRRFGVAVTASALLCAAAVAVPSAAFAAVDDTGGATRNGTETDKAAALRASIVDRPAKNVILLIGDGMGDSEITIARNYAYGAAGRLPGIDALPLTGQYTTYSLHKSGPDAGKPDYVPDSAATGTAWSTGTKTYDGAIGVDVHGTAKQTLIEIAKANGLKTGDVSTAEIQDATPAVQVAHVGSRKCYGPESSVCGGDALEKGGRGSISEQLLDTRPDVVLGGGAASFAQKAKAGAWAGSTLDEQAKTRGYQVVGDAAGLAAVSAADQKSPVLGLFTPGNFPTRFAATTATVGGADAAPATCAANPTALPQQLGLKSLTNKAISLLNTKGSKGFFLQVEGASIDKQDHAADACGQIGETLDLDEGVQAALEFAKNDGNTLVIVTADHAHSSQIVDDTPPTSLSTAVRTVEGSTMKISYGTAASGGSQQHTGSQLRIAAYGPGAANVVGLTDQTDNFFTMAGALGLNRDTASLSGGAALSLSAGAVRPGEKLTATATGFAGDRQLAGTVASTPTALPRTDVISGGATVSFQAPSEPGRHALTLTGEQSGKTVTATFEVSESGQPSHPGVGGSGGAAGVGSGNSAGGSGLAATGSVVAPFALLAAALAAVGGVLLVRRRRGAAAR